MSSEDDNPRQSTLPVASNSESSLQTPQLNIDCLEELFEWMSLLDLLVFRRTCKRYKQAVDYYIKSTYPSVGKIEISDKNWDQFSHIEPNCIKLIKGIRFSIKKTTVKPNQIESIKEILGQVDDIRMTTFKFDGDFYEQFLKFCPKLKYLSVQYCAVLKMGTGNSWLTRHYPTLQHVHFDDKIYSPVETIELKTFFKLNPQIQTLSATIYFLLKNTNLLCGADIKFDQLIVSVDSYFEDEMTCVCDLLRKLHHYGFYKRIQIRGLFCTSAQDEIDLFGTIAALEKISLFNREVALPSLPHLKELRFTISGIPSEIEAATINLRNIKRIYFDNATFDSILFIIQHFPKLHLIKVNDIEDGTHFEKNVIDLKEINKERQKLNEACKITIYVKDTIFMATKYAKMKTNFNFVELKRNVTHEWEHPY